VSISAQGFRTPAATVGVTALGVAGFVLHSCPMYSGAAASSLAGQPAATWPGIGGLVLLLAGLLAVPGRTSPAGHYRTAVAVLSAFGLLLALMGLVDRPTAAAVGWALVVVVALAAAQTALAMLALMPEVAEPDGAKGPIARAEAPESRSTRQNTRFPSHFDAWESYEQRRGSAFGEADQAAAPSHAQDVGAVSRQPERPVRVDFTPPGSPAARGAQPTGGAAFTAPGVWGHNAEPPVERGRGDAPSARPPWRSEQAPPAGP
jgi:hypothetical protein